MGSLFENYEQQYSVLTADVTAQIGLLGASGTSKIIHSFPINFDRFS